MNWLSRRMARSRLGVTEPVFNALTRGLLLGYMSADMYSDQAILSYQRFGTQWEAHERFGPSTRAMGDEVHDSLPAVEAIGPQPPATQTHMEIAPAANVFEVAKKTDAGWMAHIYLVPNYFYFPNLTELALVGPLPLRLSEPRAVSSNNPFHAFLTFWKVYEEVVYVRRRWGAKHKRCDTRIREEVFPDLFAFGSRPEELADPSEHPGERPEEQLRGGSSRRPRRCLTVRTALR